MTACVELGLVFKDCGMIEVVSSKKSSAFVCVALLIAGIASAEINGIAEVRSYNYGKYPVLFLNAACAMTWAVCLISCKIKYNTILEQVG